MIRIPELDATAALEGLIPKLDLAGISGDAWLRPDFVDEAGRPRGLVQAFVILVAGYTIMVDPGVGNGRGGLQSRVGTTCTQTSFPDSRRPAWHQATYWQSRPENEIADHYAGFADSVLPIYEAGLVDLVNDDLW